jgi:hypothetical protein
LEINEWILRQSAYLSEGQCKRISPGGDLSELIDVEKLDDYVDLNKTKFGIRMKGMLV